MGTIGVEFAGDRPRLSIKSYIRERDHQVVSINILAAMNGGAGVGMQLLQSRLI